MISNQIVAHAVPKPSVDIFHGHKRSMDNAISKALNCNAHKDRSSRADEMAAAIIDINSLHGGVQTTDLIAAGFTSAEIIEHQAEATTIATGKHTRTIHPTRHSFTDMALNIRLASADKPAVPDDTALTADQVSAWKAYCAARAAYTIDSWYVLRERCITQLLGYLLKLPIIPHNRQRLVNALDAQLKQSSAGAGR